MKKSFLFLFLFALAACSQNEDSSNPDNSTAQLDGKKLMRERCFSCHNTQGTDNMLAPPMSRVKDHYWDEETSKKEFVISILNWVMDPEEENSIMPGARRKFGLMPKQTWDSTEIKAIAEYLYENEIDTESCNHN